MAIGFSPSHISGSSANLRALMPSPEELAREKIDKLVTNLTWIELHNSSFILLTLRLPLTLCCVRYSFGIETLTPRGAINPRRQATRCRVQRSAWNAGQQRASVLR